jgi:polysaccharide deacetylase 2 family uncharacterized protein YibQ
MARAGSGRGRQRSPRGVGIRWVLLGGLLLLIGGVGLLTWSGTPPGRAALLRLGADHLHAEVQAAIDSALAVGLPGYRAGPAAEQGRSPSTGDLTALDGRDFDWPLEGADGRTIRCRLVPVDETTTFWETQALIQAAIRPCGGSVLWGERIARPGRGASPLRGQEEEVERVDLGVSGRSTHTLLLYHLQEGPPQVRWSPGGRAAPGRWPQDALDGDDGEEAPLLALVIDDWGYFDNEVTRSILRLKVPLTLAVLPGLPYSRRFALEATELDLPAPSADATGPATHSTRAGLRRQRLARGCPVEFQFIREGRPSPRRREIILHLPLEPEGYPRVDPGPGAVLVGMSEQEISDRVDAALAVLPGVTGVSSHMGSRATADRPTMARLMKVLARRRLYFLDSLTSPRSVAAEEADKAGLPALRSRIFLDQVQPDTAAIRHSLGVLVRAARTAGAAVGVGHPYPETLAVLERELPRLQALGVRLVTLSELLALQRGLEPRAAS